MARYLSSPAARLRLLVGVAGALVLATGALLAVGSFLGLYVRPTSDDWCGAMKARDLGVFGITKDYYETQNGRLGNAFLTGVVYSHGLLGPKVFPLVLVIAFTAGLVLLARMIARRFDRQLPTPAVLAAVLVIELLLFYAGPRTYQALLWAPATISHTLPSILGVWSVILAVAAGRRGTRAALWGSLAFALLMGAFMGTLSEPFTAVSGVFAGTAGVLLLIPRLRARTWYPFQWCAAWCVGLVIGFAVLYTSPGAKWRRAQQPPAKSPLSRSELTAEFHDWQHVMHTVGSTWAYLAALAAGLLLGVVVTDRAARREAAASYEGHASHARELAPESVTAQVPAGAAVGGGHGAGPARHAAAAVRDHARHGGAGPQDDGPAAPFATAVRESAGWRWTLLLLPIPLTLIASFGVVVGLRMGYGASGWTFARAWFNFLFPMLVMLTGYGFLIGRALARKAANSGVPASTTLVLGLAAAVTVIASTVHLVPAVKQLTTASVSRAGAWDRQDAQIRKEAAHGEQVVDYRPLYIGGLAEPYFTRNYAKDWVAQCVSKWYHVDRIEKPAAK